MKRATNSLVKELQKRFPVGGSRIIILVMTKCRGKYCQMFKCDFSYCHIQKWESFMCGYLKRFYQLPLTFNNLY